MKGASMTPSLDQSPAFRISLFAACGILLSQDLPRWFRPSLLTGALLCCTLLLILFRKHHRAGPAIAAVVCVLLGAAKYVTDCAMSPELPDSLLTRSVVVMGTLEEDPRVFSSRQRFLLRASRVITEESALSGDVDFLVTVRRGHQDTTHHHCRARKNLASACLKKPRRIQCPSLL
jgi:hypothetical protein